jgi:hypothetical protein
MIGSIADHVKVYIMAIQGAKIDPGSGFINRGYRALFANLPVMLFYCSFDSCFIRYLLY